MVTGWAKYKKDYYYFGRTNGKMAKKCTVDGIKLDKAGKAKQTDLSVAKIKTMMRARKQLNELCKYTDTKQQKLRKCFDWIAKRPYKRYRFLKRFISRKVGSQLSQMIFLSTEMVVVFQNQQHLLSLFMRQDIRLFM